MSDDMGLTLRSKHRLSKERFGEVLDLAEKGDHSVLPEVQSIIEEFPDIVDELGNLDSMARHAMLDRLDGGHILIREAEEQKALALIEEIAGPSPSPLEKLLANQIVLCWQHLRSLEIQYAQKGSMPLKVGDYYQRSLDRAQRRHLSAVKSLAQIRELGVPTLQVNIAADGGKQVNFAKSPEAPL